MYVPPHFKEDDPQAALEVIRAEPFGILVSVVDGEPLVTHVPFSIASISPQLVLSAHVARANPHSRALEGARVTAIFRGPHGYISPRWYTEKYGDVPTWNYVAVHARGTATLAAADAAEAILERLVGEMESGAPHPWSIAGMNRDALAAMKKNIVPFTIAVDELTAKFKLGQNRSEADQEGAIAGLRATGRPGDAALARAMERL